MPREEIESWHQKAAADLDAARFLRSNADLPAEIAAFHYQQSAEKALKGLWLAVGDTPPRTHDLRALLARLPETLNLSDDGADALAPFAILSRYPGFQAQPTDDDLDTFDAFAWACVEALRNAI